MGATKALGYIGLGTSRQRRLFVGIIALSLLLRWEQIPEGNILSVIGLLLFALIVVNLVKAANRGRRWVADRRGA